MKEITTESEITTHPKMLELTVENHAIRSMYIVSSGMGNGEISTIAYSDAIKAMAWVVIRTSRHSNPVFNITKMNIHKGNGYIDFEYDMPLTRLQEEAFMESNFAVSMATKAKTLG